MEIPLDAEAVWPASAKKLHSQWWEARIARQKVQVFKPMIDALARVYDLQNSDEYRDRMTYVEPEIGPPTVQFGSTVPFAAPLLPVFTSESVAACPTPAQASKPTTAKMFRFILCCPFG